MPERKLRQVKPTYSAPNGSFVKIRFLNTDHVPYNNQPWEVEQSSLNIDVQGNKVNNRVEILMTETTQAKPEGCFVSQEIFATLYEEEGRALYEVLKQVFGEENDR